MRKVLLKNVKPDLLTHKCYFKKKNTTKKVLKVFSWNNTWIVGKKKYRDRIYWFVSFYDFSKDCIL